VIKGLDFLSRFFAFEPYKENVHFAVANDDKYIEMNVRITTGLK